MPLSSNEKGTTLVELMVVLVFIAIGVLVLSVVQTRSFTDVHSTGRQTRALDVAQMEMEAARAAGHSLVQPDSGVVDGFNWRRDTTVVDPALTQVTVTVSWTDKNQSKSVRFIDLLSSR